MKVKFKPIHRGRTYSGEERNPDRFSSGFRPVATPETQFRPIFLPPR